MNYSTYEIALDTPLNERRYYAPIINSFINTKWPRRFASLRQAMHYYHHAVDSCKQYKQLGTVKLIELFHQDIGVPHEERVIKKYTLRNKVIG